MFILTPSQDSLIDYYSRWYWKLAYNPDTKNIIGTFIGTESSIFYLGFDFFVYRWLKVHVKVCSIFVLKHLKNKINLSEKTSSTEITFYSGST